MKIKIYTKQYKTFFFLGGRFWNRNNLWLIKGSFILSHVTTYLGSHFSWPGYFLPSWKDLKPQERSLSGYKQHVVRMSSLDQSKRLKLTQVQAKWYLYWNEKYIRTVTKAQLLPPKTIAMKAITIVGFSVPEAFSCDGHLGTFIIHNTLSYSFLRNTACVRRKIRSRRKTNSLNYVKS